MALLEVNFLSESLRRSVTFHIFLPNDVPEEFKTGNPHYLRTVKTLYLLHGYTGSSIDWITGSLVMELSRSYNLAIVMPTGENSFYIDRKPTGQAYETYAAKELVEYVSKTFGLSAKKEDLFIGGISMGGFGSLRLGIKYSDTFGAAFGLSAALIIEEISRIKKDTNGFALEMANYEYYEEIFGDPEKVKESPCNPEYLVRENQKNGKETLPIFMACGSEDFLIENNRRFRDALLSMHVNVTYYESPGVHDWKFWNEYLEPAVVWGIEQCEKIKKGEKQ